MESPFTPLLTTNYAPSHDELEQIKQVLIVPTIQRNDLDTEILRLQAKRDRLNDFIIPHLSLLSPIRRIPQDVLQEIFVWCLPTAHNSIMSGREAPLLLGRVCSSWRSISRATPKLWSSIHISIPESFTGHEPDTDKIFTQAIIDWLNRSGALPLSISIYQGMGFEYVLQVNLTLHLRLFASRWKHIVLSLRHAEFAAFAAIPTAEVPLLESLSIQFYMGRERRDGWFTKPCGLLQAPRLRGLMICSSLVFNVSVSWSQLTELIITETERSLRADTALAILKRCENLVSCNMAFPSSLSDIFPEPEGNILNVTVILPFLKTLSIRGGNNLGPFFDHLHLPMLLNLTLRLNCNDRTTFECPPLYALLRRSTTLNGLSINANSLRRETLVNCITETPHITKLYLDIWRDGSRSTLETDFYPVDDHVLGLLTPATDKAPLCPFLRNIAFKCSGVSDDAFLDFVRSRTTLSSSYGVAKLDYVEIRLPREKREGTFFIPPDVTAGGTEVVVTHRVHYVLPRYPRNPSCCAVQHTKLASWTSMPWV